MLIILVKVDESIERKFLIRELAIGSRSQKVSADRAVRIASKFRDIISVDTGVKQQKLSMRLG
jgi:hypothetical protein